MEENKSGMTYIDALNTTRAIKTDSQVLMEEVVKLQDTVQKILDVQGELIGVVNGLVDKVNGQEAYIEQLVRYNKLGT